MTLPRCAQCGEAGMHSTVDDCLAALRRVAAELHRRNAVALDDARQPIPPVRLNADVRNA